MMKKVFFGLASVVLLIVQSSASAHFKTKASCCEYAPAYYGGGCGAGACGSTQYVDQMVTTYQQVTKWRDVPVTSVKWVPRQVPRECRYTAYESVTVPETRKVSYCEVVSKEVPYSWTENQYITTPEKKTVTYCEVVRKEVPYSWTENQITWVPQTRKETYCVIVPVPKTYTATVMESHTEWVPQTVTEYQMVPTTEPCTWTEMQTTTEMTHQTRVSYVCVPRTVTETVPVCHRVAVPACGSVTPSCGGCGGCGTTSCAPAYTCQYVTDYQTVCRTVMDRVAQSCDVVVPVVKCIPITKTGTRTVMKCVPTPKTVNVAVVKCVPVLKTYTCTSYESQSQTRDVTVNVPQCVPVVKTGVRIVCENEMKTKVVDVPVTHCVPVVKNGMHTVCENVMKTRDVTVNVVKCVPKEMVSTVMETVYDKVETPTVQKQCYTECVPVQTMVKVAVWVPAVPSCGGCGVAYSSPCVSCGCH